MKDALNIVPSYPLESKSNKEKASYCIGLEAGNSIRMQFDDIDLELLLNGFQDAIKQTKPKISKEEFQSIMNLLRQQVEQQQKAYISQMAVQNKKAGEEFLAKNKEQEGIHTLPSGLQYKILESGEGPSPLLTDFVTVHYSGNFITGKVFDSSYEREKPHVFPVNRVIAGWAEALQLMKVGDKWQLFIPSYLAYGEAGFPPHIEPNTTLIFEMKLLGINEG